jgi:hypothetical protein
MCAAMLAPWNVVEVLLAAGANPHAVASGTGALAGGNALDFAALQGHEDNVRQWLTRFPKWDLERKGAMLGFTPLSFAVGNGYQRAQSARVLLEAGADVQARNHLGCSALSHLANKDDEDLETARLLLDWGVDVNAQQEPGSLKWRLLMASVRASVRCGSKSALQREMATWNQSSALHFAAQRGHVDLVRVLLSYGANPELRNGQKLTPLQLARATYGNGFAAMEAVFAEHPNGGAAGTGISTSCTLLGSLGGRRFPGSKTKGQSKVPASSGMRCTARAGG